MNRYQVRSEHWEHIDVDTPYSDGDDWCVTASFRNRVLHGDGPANITHMTVRFSSNSDAESKMAAERYFKQLEEPEFPSDQPGAYRIPTFILNHATVSLICPADGRDINHLEDMDYVKALVMFRAGGETTTVTCLVWELKAAMEEVARLEAERMHIRKVASFKPL